jgi:prolyl oligopeptidase
MDVGSVGPPVWRGETQFFSRRAAGCDYPVVWMAGPDGQNARVLLDPLRLDPAGNTLLDRWKPSPDGSLVAYQTSVGGTERSALWVLETATGRVTDGPLERCRYSPVAWLPDQSGLFYVRESGTNPTKDAGPRREVAFHRLGTEQAADPVVFDGPPGRAKGWQDSPRFGLAVSLDKRWLIVSAAVGTSRANDVWLADLTGGSPARLTFQPFVQGQKAQFAPFFGRDGRLYVLTDLHAPRHRLCLADSVDAPCETWRDLIAEDPEAVMTSFTILDGGGLHEPVILTQWTRHAVSEITVHDAATGQQLSSVALPGMGTVTQLLERPEGGHEAWMAYTDFTTPPRIYHYDSATGRLSLWATSPNEPDLPQIDVERVTYPGKDGTPVRMFVIRRPGPAGSRPAILTGYGGFGVSLSPMYSSAALAWVSDGGVYAVANIRGGGEGGQEWHHAGMRERKQNCFDDFCRAAETLITGGITTPSQLAITGTSNGGLLVGAVITQRPELFSAAVCSSAILDMSRYEGTSIGRGCVAEYGSAGHLDELKILLAYSPYHNVRSGVRYPATLFTCSESDTRVDPMHARKMCALMQEYGNWPVILRSEAGVGHGARAASKAARQTAEVLSFIAAHTTVPVTGTIEAK